MQGAGTCTEVTTHRVSGLFSRGRFSLAICAKSISPPSTTFQSFFTSTEGSRALVCTWLGCCRKCAGTHVTLSTLHTALLYIYVHVHYIQHCYTSMCMYTTYSTAIHLCACTLYTALLYIYVHVHYIQHCYISMCMYTTYSTAIHLCACTLHSETHIKSDGLVVSCILASSFPKWAESDSSNSLCGCVSHIKREECLRTHTHAHSHTHTHTLTHTHVHAHTHTHTLTHTHTHTLVLHLRLLWCLPSVVKSSALLALHKQ